MASVVFVCFVGIVMCACVLITVYYFCALRSLESNSVQPTVAGSFDNIAVRRNSAQFDRALEFDITRDADEYREPQASYIVPVSAVSTVIICMVCFSLVGLTRWQSPIEIVLLAIFSAYALSAAIIDFKTQLLIDDIVQPMLWTGLIVNAFNAFVSLHAAVAGAVLGFVLMWLVSMLLKMALGNLGVGFGDLKFIAAVGAWFGPEIVLVTLMVSSISFVAFILLFQRRKSDDSAGPVDYPMGAFLAGGALVCQLFYLDQLLGVVF